jgi:hypothetical protein
MENAFSPVVSVTSQLAYLVLSLGTTVWVGRTIYKNGAAFLADIFLGKEVLADSVNRLLLTGFYLVNGGWVVLKIRNVGYATRAQHIIENFAESYGKVLLILGMMHFLNLYVLARMRRRALSDRGSPPLAPEHYFRPKEA